MRFLDTPNQEATCATLKKSPFIPLFSLQSGMLAAARRFPLAPRRVER